MTTKMKRFAVLGVMAWLRPQAAAAQIAVPQTPAPIRIGPLSVYPTINVRDVGTDSNVFSDATNPKDDFTFTINPRLIALLPVGSARLTVLNSNDFVFYRQYKDEQSANKQLGARFDFSFSRLRPFVSGERVWTRERPNLEIDTRARRAEYNASAGLDFKLTTATALTLSARQDQTLFAEGEKFRGVDLADALDRKGQSATGGVKITLTPFTTLLLAAEVQQDRFSRSSLRDSDSLRIAPALEFSPDAAIAGRAAAGFRRFKPLNPALVEYRGLVAAVGVVYTLLGVTTFDVQATRDVMYSFEDTEPYYLSTGGRVTVTQRLFGPLSLVVNGQRQLAEYQALRTTRLGGRTDTVDAVGGGFKVRIGPNLQIGFTGERTERRSTNPGQQQQYQRTRLLGSATLGS